SDPAVVRALRELSHSLKSTFTTVVLLSPTLVIPPEIEKEVSVLDVPLPGYRDLLQLLKEIVDVVRRNHRARVELTKDDADQLIRASLGLTLSEAESAFAKAIAVDGRLSRDDVPLVLEEKRQVIRKSGLLEYFSPDRRLRDVGGLASLKRWLDRRGAAFSEAARRFGLPEPKGLLLLGVQGCGKSLTAKAIAAQWGLPLLRLDMGRIFSGLIGSSEENLRRAIRVAESVAPVVLWVDEIEKGLAGTQSSGVSDGGVSARVFGALLTWLQEKTAPVFVVATANRIELLPPELLRKGRFDELFFIDLPALAERREILEIHVARRGRDPARFDLQRLAGAARGFSGAELEEAVVAGLYDAFADGVELDQGHLERALAEARPLSTTMAEEIGRLREWARSRTRPASDPAEGAEA
ncbi:MAG TPA: AAA family ATPase, partial [Anaeromyxobacter sp.]|nr:AAA family ATPase [Anaeromyxobacter sp.]